MMDVSISGMRPANVQAEDIHRVLKCVLRATHKASKGSVSVAFVSDVRMRDLNRRWRHKNKTTDVLSFASPAMPALQTSAQHLGDIFVSPVTVRREAQRRSIDFQEEILRVIAHGMLHLIGYDHATEDEEAAMFKLQERSVECAFSDL